MPDTMDDPASIDTKSSVNNIIINTNNNDADGNVTSEKTVDVNESTNFFEKLEACLPPDEVNLSDGGCKSGEISEKTNTANSQSKSDSENKMTPYLDPSLASLDEMPGKCDTLKTQKSELELLKEKIMKLEMRNNELEKKLTTNFNTSKDTSLNDSFNFNTNLTLDDVVTKSIDDTIPIKSTQTSTDTNTTNIFSTPTAQQNNHHQYTNNMLFNTMKNQATSSNPTALKNIPNINQGGFIITSTGSIAYVPPTSSSLVAPNPNPTSTPIHQRASSSFTASSSNTIDFNVPGTEPTSKLDTEPVKPNSINLDLSSFLTKNNLLNLNPTKLSPNKLNEQKTQVQQQPTAFILSSNGQLVPMLNNNNINHQKASAVSQSTPYILPKPALLPKQPIAANTSLNIKPTKPKPTVTKTKNIKSKPQPTVVTSPPTVPTAAPTEPVKSDLVPIAPALVNDNGKHRAIRPKPSSNSTNAFTNIQPKLVPKLPVNTTIKSPPKQQQLNYGVIKINTMSPEKTNMVNLNGAIMLETNDILSKAASMIFSPSEFTLSNLSPSTTAAAAPNVTTTSPSTNSFQVQVVNTGITEPPPGKIAIQRNTPNIQPKKLALKPSSQDQENLLKPAAKLPIKKNTQKTKQPASSKPTSNNNKVPIAPNKPVKLAAKSAPVHQSQPTAAITNESLASMCDFEKAFGTLVSTPTSEPSAPETTAAVVIEEGVTVPTTTEQTLKQQEFDQQIQQQLSSILNGTSPAQVKQDALEQTSKSKSPLKQVASPSMPSLDDFFCIGNQGNTENFSPVKNSPEKPPKKSSKSTKPGKKVKSVTSSPVKSNKKVLLAKQTTSTSPPTTSPTKTQNNVQIRPKIHSKVKPSKSNTNEPATTANEKLKFELSDLDKVLQQVESIASITASHQTPSLVSKPPSDKDTTSPFDLLETKNEDAPTVTTSSPNSKPVKKSGVKKNLQESPGVLSTPPSLVSTSKATKKTGKSRNTQQTPVKMTVNSGGLFEDSDFFSFLKDKEPEVLMKSDVQEQILTKKRGRPPKPSQQKATSGNNESKVNTSLGDNETSLDLTDSENSDSKKQCQLEDECKELESSSKCILNAAVENTFQDLINSKNETFAGFLVNGKSREKSCDVVGVAANGQVNNNASPNNKENAKKLESEDDFNSFVYEIGGGGVGGGECNVQSEEPPMDITIASLMSGQGLKNRKRARGNVVKAKCSPEKMVSVGKVDEDVKEKNEVVACDEAKRMKKEVCVSVSETSVVDNLEHAADGASTETTIAALAASTITNEKRKRGRPNKQTSQNKSDAPEAKAPNYKKINNPEGTTSLLALNTPPTNIEYAGLTRFEIPFENEEEPEEPTTAAPAINEKKQDTLPSPPKRTKSTSSDNSDNSKEDSTKVTSADILPEQTPMEQDPDDAEPPTSNSEAVLIDNIQKTIMDFTQVESEATKIVHEEPKTVHKEDLDQKEILDNLYETTVAVANSKQSNNYSGSFIEDSNNTTTGGYWSNQAATKVEETNEPKNKDSEETVGAVKKATHFSHFDLENDPIVNKDLQQLHSSKPTPTSGYTNTSHFITNITNQQQQGILTPPSSTASYGGAGGHQHHTGNNNNNNSLSINPGSTSSTTSTQMISPVSGADLPVTNNTNSYMNGATSSYYSNSTYYGSNNNNSSSGQFGQVYPPTKPVVKPITPTKYTHNTTTSYTEGASGNQDTMTSGLYRSNSATSLQITNSNNPNLQPKTPIQQQQNNNTSQLNASQSPQQRHSISLCSTPTPSTPLTPQAPTTPTHSAYQPYQQAASTSPLSHNQQQQQRTNINPPKGAVTLTKTNLFPQQTMYTQTNLFSHHQNPAMWGDSFNESSMNKYPVIGEQYNKQPVQQQQASKLPQYDQSYSYQQGYYMNNHHHHHQPSSQTAPTPNYLPNLLTPAYPNTQPVTPPITDTKPPQPPPPSKHLKPESKKSSSKQSKTKSTKSTAAPVYHSQSTNNYEKMMSVNAATALHAAANWYDFTSQVGKGSSTEAAAIASLSTFFQKQQDGTGQQRTTSSGYSNNGPGTDSGHFANAQQTSQYNSQFQQSSLNSLFASGSSSNQPTNGSANQKSNSRTNSQVQSVNSGAYNSHSSHYQQQHVVSGGNYSNSSKSSGGGGLGQSGLGRTGSGTNGNDVSVYRQTQQQGEPVQMHMGTYHYQGQSGQHQMSHNHQQHGQTSLSQHNYPGVGQGAQAAAAGQFSYPGQFGNQAGSMHQTEHHHHHLPTGNPVLTFPHHHQAMNSLLANQFSSVPPFNVNWHPKI